MRTRPLALIAIAPAAIGCAGTVSGSSGTGDAEASTISSAVVVVERTVDPAEGSRAEASARFVRVAAGTSAQDALRSIGAALELPRRGACASVVTLAGGVARSEPAQIVELQDVGSVSLEAAGLETRLVPRQLPDVTDVVSGVVYARAADPSALPAATRYVVHVGGLADREPFDFAASAPGDPNDIQVAGEKAQGQLVVDHASIDFAWTQDGTDAVVYVDVQPSGVRCVLGDGEVEGGGRSHATLPASLLDDAGSIVLHRLQRESFRARGLESGEIRFDFARTLAYVRR